MKKLFIGITALVNLSMLNAEMNWADKFTEFKKMSKEQKLEWFDFAKKWHTKKIDMMKDHKKQWFDYGIKNIEEWDEANITTQADKAKLFHEQLKKAIEIRKQHSDDWKDYYDSFQQEGEKIHKNHLMAITSFEKSLEASQEIDNDDEQENDNDNDDDEQEDADDENDGGSD